MKKNILNPLSASLLIALATVGQASVVHAQNTATAAKAATPKAAAAKTVAPTETLKTVSPESAELLSADLASIGPALDLILGKSTLLRMPSEVTRISVGNPEIADVARISATELYLLGKAQGSTNLIIWRKGSSATAVDIRVSPDLASLRSNLASLLPNEKSITVSMAADTIVLSGMVSSGPKAKFAEDIANAFVRDLNKKLIVASGAGDKAPAGANAGAGAQKSATIATADTTSVAGSKIVNMLRVADPQQVMLEVKIAEVSRSLAERMGINLAQLVSSGNSARLLSGLIGGGQVTLGRFSGLVPGVSDTGVSVPALQGYASAGTQGAGVNLAGGVSKGTTLSIDAQKQDGLIKILAEPNLVAISGQEASFLAGGKLLIPVSSQSNNPGTTSTSLEEKEFGVGVKFIPTVLEGGRIHLRVTSEASELSSTGTQLSAGGVTNILPSFSTRRAQTSVQLMDGQSLAIAGLIKNNTSQAMDKIPGLGEIPVLGALFRSNDFRSDRSELMFVITPRLIKPLDENYILPTDSYVPPSQSELYLGNKLEGSGRPDIPADSRPAAKPAAPGAAPVGGMEVK